MAARCWIPTKSWLVNDPHTPTVPQRFGLCWSHPKQLEAEREQVCRILKQIKDGGPETLAEKRNPLVNQVRKIEKFLAPEASRISAHGKFVSVVICTSGEPTDEDGKKGKEVRKELRKSLLSLSKLPVKIVFRLCTDDEEVRL